MFRSAASVIALSLVAIQVAVASTIKPGVYLIQDLRTNLYLGIGPVPPVYPPLDVPLRLVPENVAFYDKWRVSEGEDGGIIISSGRGGPDDYKIVNKDDAVFVSAVKSPEVWEASRIGGERLDVEIKLQYKDRVFTSDKDGFPQVTLKRAVGEDNQHFRFIPIEREHMRELYHHSRFTIQDTC
ncbi:hypothetical protein EC991_006619 [Linnemannia zychae]|nr:hypothetical protein EC991_006619 [Linnemannia zychae]